MFLGMLGVVAAALLDTQSSKALACRAILIATGLLVLGLVWVSQVRSSQFRDDFQFSRRRVETNPAAKVARNNYGAALAERGKYAEAVEQQRAAISLDPGFAHAYTDLALGLALAGEDASLVAELQI